MKLIFTKCVEHPLLSYALYLEDETGTRTLLPCQIKTSLTSAPESKASIVVEFDIDENSIILED